MLPDEVIAGLRLRPGATVVDCTLGLGGHAERILNRIGDAGRLVGLDVDASNLARTEIRLRDEGPRATLVRANFSDLGAALDGLGIDRVDGILADLGPSSTQIDDAARGFSFQTDGPLDMRLDDRQKTTAADLVNALRESELADLIFENSQERQSRRIARRICEARRGRRITRTSQLERIVSSAIGAASHKSRIHPATRTFLALRMAVNDELGRLNALLAEGPKRLAPGGRIVIISFHSGEDRCVKRDFLARRAAGLYTLVTKKPITPSENERKANPRARSAKLRVAERTDKSVEGRGAVLTDRQ